MSKIHVLEADDVAGNYRIILHTATPAGSNSASKTWKSIVIATGLNATILTVGTAPGNITQVEKDSIIAGDTLEISTNIFAESGGATSASLDLMADAHIDAYKASLARKYKYYGYTQG